MTASGRQTALEVAIGAPSLAAALGGSGVILGAVIYAAVKVVCGLMAVRAARDATQAGLLRTQSAIARRAERTARAAQRREERTARRTRDAGRAVRRRGGDPDRRHKRRRRPDLSQEG
jgi:hypothetical protein